MPPPRTTARGNYKRKRGLFSLAQYFKELP